MCGWLVGDSDELNFLFLLYFDGRLEGRGGTAESHLQCTMYMFLSLQFGDSLFSFYIEHYFLLVLGQFGGNKIHIWAGCWKGQVERLEKHIMWSRTSLTTAGFSSKVGTVVHFSFPWVARSCKLNAKIYSDFFFLFIFMEFVKYKNINCEKDLNNE